MGEAVPPLIFVYKGVNELSRGKEYSRPASEYGQMMIIEQLKKISGGDFEADLAEKADAGDVGSVAANGNYIKKSDTKNVCENLVLLDTQVKANADAVALKAASADVYNKTAIDGLISDDGTTKTLFGLVVSIDSTTGAVTLSEPVVETPSETQGEG